MQIVRLLCNVCIWHIRFFLGLSVAIFQRMADACGAEIGAAHRAELTFGLVRCLVILQCTFRVEGQIELVFPSEVVAGLAQRVVADGGAGDAAWPGRAAWAAILYVTTPVRTSSLSGRARCSFGVT